LTTLPTLGNGVILVGWLNTHAYHESEPKSLSAFVNTADGMLCFCLFSPRSFEDYNSILFYFGAIASISLRLAFTRCHRRDDRFTLVGQCGPGGGRGPKGGRGVGWARRRAVSYRAVNSRLSVRAHVIMSQEQKDNNIRISGTADLPSNDWAVGPRPTHR
jgi:hypothetical protein